MPTMSCTVGRILAAASAAALMFASPLRSVPSLPLALAAEDGVVVEQAWARASAGAAANGAAYVTLMGGAKPDSLVGASTQAATLAEVHESINDNNIMKMRRVTAVPIQPHERVTFAPGGYHIMLTGLKQPLAAGQSFPLTLTFAHAAPVTVDVKVRAVGHDSSTDSHDHMKM